MLNKKKKKYTRITENTPPPQLGTVKTPVVGTTNKVSKGKKIITK